MSAKVKTSTKPKKKLASTLLRLAKSKTLDHFNIQLRGKVSRVSKKSFLLEKEGSTLKIELTDLTQVQKEISPRKRGERPFIKPVNFKKIRKGDEVCVNFSLTKEGEIKTLAILVRLPSL